MDTERPYEIIPTYQTAFLGNITFERCESSLFYETESRIPNYKLFQNDLGDPDHELYDRLFKEYVVYSYPTNLELSEEDDRESCKLFIDVIIANFGRAMRALSANTLYDFDEARMNALFVGVLSSSKDLFDERGFYFGRHHMAFETEEPLASSTSKVHGIVKKNISSACAYYTKNVSQTVDAKFKPTHCFLDASIKLRRWSNCMFYFKSKSSSSAFVTNGAMLSKRCRVFDFEFKYQNLNYMQTVRTLTSDAVLNPVRNFSYESTDPENNELNFKGRLDSNTLGLLSDETLDANVLNTPLLDTSSWSTNVPRGYLDSNHFKSRYAISSFVSKWRSHFRSNVVRFPKKGELMGDNLTSFVKLMSLKFKRYGSESFDSSIMDLYAEAINGRNDPSKKIKGGLAHYDLYRKRESETFKMFAILGGSATGSPESLAAGYEPPKMYVSYDESTNKTALALKESSVSEIIVHHAVVIGVADVLFFHIITK